MKTTLIAILSAIAFTTSQGFAETPAPTPAPQSESKPAEPVGSIQTDPAKNQQVIDEAKKVVEAPASSGTSAADAKSPSYFGFNLGLGIPYVMGYGLDYVMPNKYLSFGLGGGGYSFKSSDVSIGIRQMQLAARFHPFQGSFYLGALYGQQNLTGEQTQTISGQSVTVKVDIKSMYLTPHVGWMWGIADGGLFASMEFGYQVPMSSSTDFSTTAPTAVQSTAEYIKLDADVRDAGNKIGKTSIPFLTLIKLGWLF